MLCPRGWICCLCKSSLKVPSSHPSHPKRKHCACRTKANAAFGAVPLPFIRLLAFSVYQSSLILMVSLYSPWLCFNHMTQHSQTLMYVCHTNMINLCIKLIRPLSMEHLFWKENHQPPHQLSFKNFFWHTHFLHFLVLMKQQNKLRGWYLSDTYTSGGYGGLYIFTL